MRHCGRPPSRCVAGVAAHAWQSFPGMRQHLPSTPTRPHAHTPTAAAAALPACLLLAQAHAARQEQTRGALAAFGERVLAQAQEACVAAMQVGGWVGRPHLNRTPSPSKRASKRPHVPKKRACPCFAAPRHTTSHECMHNTHTAHVPCAYAPERNPCALSTASTGEVLPPPPAPSLPLPPPPPPPKSPPPKPLAPPMQHPRRCRCRVHAMRHHRRHQHTTHHHHHHRQLMEDELLGVGKAGRGQAAGGEDVTSTATGVTAR